jgi:hypothetical protein
MLILHGVLFLSACAGSGETLRIPVWSERTELAASRQPERVFVTPDLHDLVLLMRSEDPTNQELAPVRVSLHNAIIPSIRVSVERPDTHYRYEYTVSNGAAARDNIVVVSVAAPGLLLGTDADYYVNGVKNHTWWMGGVGSALMAKQRELDKKVVGRSISWASLVDEEHASSDLVNILPGRSRSGFRIDSSLMPGFTTGVLEGLHYAPPGEALTDPDIDRQLVTLDVENYFDRTALTFGPMFLPGASAAEVLANYRMGIQKLNQCDAIPHNAEFLGEVAAILREPGVESKLSDRLERMKSRPTTPVEIELVNCLRLVAKSFVGSQLGK